MGDVDLVDFLRARLNEDEAAVARLDHYNPDEGGYYACPGTRPSGEPYGDLPSGEEHCDCGLAERRRREELEVEAKRRIIDEIRGSLMTRAADSDGEGWVAGHWQVAEDLLRLLALPYRDHPEYRREWTP